MSQKFNVIRSQTFFMDTIILAFLWIGSIALVNPFGNFPLNDDWSYGYAVRGILEEGTFRPIGWTGMTLISQALWGALFCLPFGFSFTALRFSTLSLAFVGLVGIYVLLRSIQIRRLIAIFGALILAFNPIYFALSFTFMTDVPFTVLTILGLVCLVRRLQVESELYLVAGTCIVTVAILCRQLGLFLPLAFAPVFLIQHGISRCTIIRAFAPLVVGASAFIGYEYWLGLNNAVPSMYRAEIPILLDALSEPKTLVFTIGSNSFIAVLNLGLYLFPCIIYCSASGKKMINSTTILGRLVFCLFLISAWYFLLARGQVLPLVGNILESSGIGPVVLHDSYILGLPNVEELPISFWMSLTFVSIVSGGILLANLFTRVQRLLTQFRGTKLSVDKAITFFLILGGFLYCLPIFVTGYYDRYLLPLLPSITALILAPSQTTPLTTGRRYVLTLTFSILLFLLFSVAATKDYLTWNRVRWSALRSLLSEQALTPSDIDGGFEFNGWYLYDPKFYPDNGKSWWWVDNDDYIVSMGPIVGYNVFQKYSFQKWLPPGKGEIFVLRRNDVH